LQKLLLYRWLTTRALLILPKLTKENFQTSFFKRKETQTISEEGQDTGSFYPKKEFQKWPSQSRFITAGIAFCSYRGLLTINSLFSKCHGQAMVVLT